MASDKGGSDDANMKRTVETQDWLSQKAEIDAKFKAMADSIKVCEAVMNDLHALKEVLVNKSLQDANLKSQKETEKSQKETEEPPPKTSP